MMTLLRASPRSVSAAVRGLRVACGRTLAILVLAGLGASCSREPQGPAVAELVRVAGSVQLHRQEKQRPAQPAPLFAGDLLVTGAASSAVVRFAGGAEVELAENSRFVVDGTQVAISLDLSEGSILFRGAAGGSGSRFEVLTPFGISRLPADAEARLGVTAAGVTVEVTTGEITFFSQDGKEQRASQGQQLQVKLGEFRLVSKKQPDAGLPEAAADAGAPAAPMVTLAAIEVTLHSKGKVQLRAAGEKRFRSVDGTRPLAPGSEFVVPARGSAQLAAPGMRLELAGGARGKLGSATRTGDTGRLELSLPNGKANLILGPGEHELVIAGAKGELVVRSHEESTLELLQGPRGPSLEVRAGGVEVAWRGETRAVAAGESLQLGEKIGSGAARPALVVRAHERITIYSERDPIALTWAPTPGPVQVQIARDPGFAELVVSGRVEGHAARLTPAGPERLYWRVRDLEGRPLHDGQLRFTSESKRAAGLHPHNEISQTGQKAVVYYQSALPSLSLLFPKVEGARQYRLQLFRSSELGKPLLEKVVTEERCELKAGELGEGSYLWNVTALGLPGAESGSLMNKLDIVFDNAIAELILELPKPGERVGQQVKIKGVAPLLSRLFVQDRAVALDSRGRFETEVPAAPKLVFRLSRANTESYWIRSLRTR